MASDRELCITRMLPANWFGRFLQILNILNIGGVLLVLSTALKKWTYLEAANGNLSCMALMEPIIRTNTSTKKWHDKNY